jgi:hypothetical protein
MGRPATFDDLTEVLREQSEAIKNTLNVTKANMFIPTDGQGLRIHVSVPRGDSGKWPEQIELRLNDGTEVVVPIEIIEDYQPVEPQ